ncbi:Peptidoglycan/LPS O-acetylase OafA/YrhL, contains acyltransferase and SGNH-hydrolase domains [Arachidicoccus rhizosphaerae]|uniref:Peptidoglycan/LPS O-acetylase OafA/YrhL, contains acyltransferase and SGNH-hydrolase domains n=1 Tax=Arachidicoccus rhizosphaerae TaxID=551991 RepID=A0A1H4BNL3_9BACT|nr:acyltransferase [Arachidicoccus rhizosphaerae]SEA49654.1 Peptidoglycan/LPS O-acetylase OafA/YrhL, contains acyltransferase and SGNH-hydrolase domains [Arachidicoccus rhizosphaerae]
MAINTMAKEAAVDNSTVKSAAPANVLLTTRTHYMALDGLRGIAAVAVVIFHFMEFIIPDYADSFIGHAYLAVDFFFCLSGFVVAYAYDNRIKKLGKAAFFKMRLIRLQPMVVIGAFIGLLTFLLDPFHHFYAQYGCKDTAVMFLSAAFMIPHPAMPERYNNLFYFNPPTWSLFWEYIANICYAVILFKIHKKILIPLTILAACILVYTAHQFGNLSIGWGAENWIGGAARLFYSFLAGILVYRSKWLIQNKLGFLGMGALLAIAFLIPYVDRINWITEPIIVIFYFPLLVALGAGVRINKSVQPACKFLGDISYPLYMVHYPFLWVFLSYLETQKPSMGQLYVQIPVITCLLIGFAYIMAKFIDEPVRKYLKGRWQKGIKATRS